MRRTSRSRIRPLAIAIALALICAAVGMLRADAHYPTSGSSEPIQSPSGRHSDDVTSTGLSTTNAVTGQNADAGRGGRADAHDGEALQRETGGGDLGSPPPTPSEDPLQRTAMDPLQRCARKALAGEFGGLTEWQRAGYEYAIANSIEIPAGNRSKVTSYGPWEPCGTHCYSGDRARTSFCAVPKRLIPLGALIWTPAGLRYAMDTGGAVHVGVCSYGRVTRRTENMNIDYYTLRPMHTAHDQPWVLVKAATDWNWYGARAWGDWSRQGPYPGGLTREVTN